MSEEKNDIEISLPLNEGDQKVISKDKETCVALISLDHSPEEIKITARKNGNPILHYHFPATAWEDYDKFNRGVPITVVIQKYQAADRSFKTQLHRATEELAKARRDRK